MTNLVFLEAAAQSDSAAEIIESNEALINFATAEVDSLVEEQALHTAWHVGSFVEESFDITYENMTDPISDIVVEATSVFADVIASDVSDSEKKELIEGYAHIIAMGDSELIAEGVISGAIGGAATLGAIGGAIGGARALFSKEREHWKELIRQEKDLIRSGADKSKLNKITDLKIKARADYIKHRRKIVGGTARHGARIGGVMGAIAGVNLSDRIGTLPH